MSIFKYESFQALVMKCQRSDCMNQYIHKCFIFHMLMKSMILWASINHETFTQRDQCTVIKRILIISFDPFDAHYTLWNPIRKQCFVVVLIITQLQLMNGAFVNTHFKKKNRPLLLYISINKIRFYTFHQQEHLAPASHPSTLIYFVVIFRQICSLDRLVLTIGPLSLPPAWGVAYYRTLSKQSIQEAFQLSFFMYLFIYLIINCVIFLISPAAI